jgi:hypothetical protein
VANPIVINAGISRKSEANAANRYQPRKIHFIPGTRRHFTQWVPDFCLLELDRDITQAAAKPIRIITRQEVQAGLERVGVDAFISGWGRTSVGGPLPDQLQGLMVKVAPGQGNSVSDASLYIGVQKDGAGPCGGDSGGPMSVRDAGGQGILVGAANRVTGPCGDDGADMYARLSYDLEWIRSVMGSGPLALAPPAQAGSPGAMPSWLRLDGRRMDRGAPLRPVLPAPRR